MAILKKILFPGMTTAAEIAVTQVALENTKTGKEANALTLTSTNTGVDDAGHPVYTIGLAIDGKTVVKGDNGLESGLALVYHAAKTTGDAEQDAHISLTDNAGKELSTIKVSDLVGNGIIESSEYDAATGMLKLYFKNGTAETTEVDVDLTALLDFEDIVIKADSTDYLGFEKNAAATGDASQAQFVAKVKELASTADAVLTYTVADDGTVTYDAQTAGTLTGEKGLADAANVAEKVKTYIDGKIATVETKIKAEKEGLEKKIAAVENQIKDLDVEDAAVAGQYVSAVSETDGKIAVTRANVGNAVLTGFAVDEAATGSIAATDTISAALNKLQNKANATTVMYQVTGTQLEFFNIQEK